MSSPWYDPFRWNDLLFHWRVYHSRHAADRPTGKWRLPLQQLLRGAAPAKARNAATFGD
jgi:hypothetical protein